MKVYVARQPIFDHAGNLYGYELLYRENNENRYSTTLSGSAATCRLLSNINNEFGLENLTGGSYAFVNFTEDLLNEEYLSMLDPDKCIIEILETVTATDDLWSQVSTLRQQGYRFALDDYVGEEEREALTELADILKVDFQLADPARQTQLARRFRGEKVMLAEKIESEEELDRAIAAGYKLFQGYYFSRPVVISKETVQIAVATYSRLWNEIAKPNPDFGRLAEIIRLDVNLSYKFLMRVNSLKYYRGRQIATIEQALIHLGMEEVKRWTLSILLQDIHQGRNETAKNALVRAVFTQRLADMLGICKGRDDAYMAGLFSSVDSAMQSGLHELLERINVSQEAKDAILDRKGRLGELLVFVEDYEMENLESLSQFLRRNGLENQEISPIYLGAVRYADQMFEPLVEVPSPSPNTLMGKIRDV